MDLVEEGMQFDGGGIFEALFWVFLEQFGKQVSQVFAPVFVYFRLSAQYLIIE